MTRGSKILLGVIGLVGLFGLFAWFNNQTQILKKEIVKIEKTKVKKFKTPGLKLGHSKVPLPLILPAPPVIKISDHRNVKAKGHRKEKQILQAKTSTNQKRTKKRRSEIKKTYSLVPKNPNTNSKENKKLIRTISKNFLYKKKKQKKNLIHVGSKDVMAGRVSLRMLEHGSGPQIEIAWPYDSQVQNRLYKIFRNCFGMVHALLSSGGALYTLNSRPGKPWEINLDKFSGFIRKPSGLLPPEERKIQHQIYKRHRNLSKASLARLFPRHVDGNLLGGLKKIIGKGYSKMRLIRARYKIIDGKIIVGNVMANNRPFSGQIVLTPRKKARCSNRKS